MNILDSIISAIADIALYAATISAGTASCFGAFQPKLPKELEK